MHDNRNGNNLISFDPWLPTHCLICQMVGKGLNAFPCVLVSVLHVLLFFTLQRLF